MSSNEDYKKPKTREEFKADREQEEKENSQPGRRKRIRIRLIPIWLRLVIIAVLVAGSALLGVIVGYSVIGDGEAKDALKKSTWQHIIDLVEKETNE